MKSVPTDFIQVFTLDEMPCQECLKGDYGFSIHRGILIQWGQEYKRSLAKLVVDYIDSLCLYSEGSGRILVLHPHDNGTGVGEFQMLIGGDGPIPDKFKAGTEYGGFKVVHVNKI